MVSGRFAESRFTEAHFAEATSPNVSFTEWTFHRKVISPNGRYTERLFHRKDTSPNGCFTEWSFRRKCGCELANNMGFCGVHLFTSKFISEIKRTVARDFFL
jgi:hypothetical protein